MDVIDYELNRYDQWREDLEKRRQCFENNTGLHLVCVANGSDKKTKIIEDDIWSVDGQLDYQEKKLQQNVDDQTSVVQKEDIDQSKDEIEKNRKKFKNLTRKQEQLLKGLSISF